MKRFAFLVCAFAALLVVSVGCGGGGVGDPLVTYDPVGDWDGTITQPAACGEPSIVETSTSRITVTGNQLTTQTEYPDCTLDTFILSGNTASLSDTDTVDYGSYHLDEVIEISITLTSDNAFSGQVKHIFSCPPGDDCSGLAEFDLPCTNTATASGTRCTNCFDETACPVFASEPPMRRRSLWGR